MCCRWALGEWHQSITQLASQHCYVRFCVSRVQAHVVNLRDAAAEGSKGLLHPLLKRYHVSPAAVQEHCTTAAQQLHSCEGLPLGSFAGVRVGLQLLQLFGAAYLQRPEHGCLQERW
jgi:hypothetical protein